MINLENYFIKYCFRKHYPSSSKSILILNVSRLLSMGNYNIFDNCFKKLIIISDSSVILKWSVVNSVQAQLIVIYSSKIVWIIKISPYTDETSLKTFESNVCVNPISIYLLNLTAWNLHRIDIDFIQ